MACHATTSNAARACQARRKRLIPYWDRFLSGAKADAVTMRAFYTVPTLP